LIVGRLRACEQPETLTLGIDISAMNEHSRNLAETPRHRRDIERIYGAMRRIRRVEEEIERLYSTDKIKSPVHLSIGQEAPSVGVCDALRPDDIVFATYRGHAAYLAKGGNLQQMIAELYGKVAGCGAGKSGSMHLIDVAAGMMGTSAIVGTTIPQAVGYAFALKTRNSDRVVASFFGDGATEEGVFHESMNFAALKRLPVLFVCENNLYAINTHIRDRQANLDLCARARSYGMPAERVASNDVFAIRDVVHRILPELRRGGGPYFIEIETYRLARHVGPGNDLDLQYRTQEEFEAWRERDELARLAGMLAPRDRERIDAAVESEISSAFSFAEATPFPAERELFENVFHE
jgi:TPP-dependent pyruvate/acetoin dehydrogenase alpha subunit